MNQIADVCLTVCEWLWESYFFLLDAHQDGQTHPTVLLGMTCFATLCWWKGCTDKVGWAFDAVRNSESKVLRYGLFLVCATTWIGTGIVERYPLGAGLFGFVLILYIGLLSRWWRTKLVLGRQFVSSVVARMTFLRHVLSGRHYCTQCHCEIDPGIEVRPALDVFWLESWCSSCCETVQVTSCKVPLWTAAVTAAICFLPDVIN